MKDENGENLSQHKFGITSLVNKRDLLQKDDTVIFKIDETSRAVEVNNKHQTITQLFISNFFKGNCGSPKETCYC